MATIICVYTIELALYALLIGFFSVLAKQTTQNNEKVDEEIDLLNKRKVRQSGEINTLSSGEVNNRSSA